MDVEINVYLCVFSGEMDDVLDCVCLVYCSRNILRCFTFMVGHIREDGIVLRIESYFSAFH